MITIECHDCENILGYAYSDMDEGNRRRDVIDDPMSVGVKDFVRCRDCFRKWQSKRPDLAFTHLVNDVR